MEQPAGYYTEGGKRRPITGRSKRIREGDSIGEPPESGVASPKRLPVVDWGGEEYFFDQRLEQLRAVNNPRDHVDLSDVETAAIAHLLESGVRQLPEDQDDVPECDVTDS